MKDGQASAVAVAHASGRHPARRWHAGGALAGNLAAGLAVPASLAAAWYLSARYGWLPDQILPSPQLVLSTAQEAFLDGSLVSGTLASLRRVAQGYLAGMAAGIVVGGAMGLSRTVRSLLDPVFLGLSQVPVLGWLPILILLVGLDEALKVIVIGWSAMVPIVLNTTQGIRDVPLSLLELGRVLSLGRWWTFRLIILPAAVPSIFTGLREGLANSWQILVAVELLASFEGLGYLMAYGRQLFQLELVLVAMLVVGVVGLSLHGLLTLVEFRLQRWRLDGMR